MGGGDHWRYNTVLELPYEERPDGTLQRPWVRIVGLGAEKPVSGAVLVDVAELATPPKEQGGVLTSMRP